jgi:RHS repeat-associated protein
MLATRSGPTAFTPAASADSRARRRSDPGCPEIASGLSCSPRVSLTRFRRPESCADAEISACDGHRLVVDPGVDPETGLQYDRARYYDPTAGQFLTRDPLEAITGAPYSYGSDNPVNELDPSGLDGIFGTGIGPNIGPNINWGAAGMAVSNAAAGALNTLTFGLSTKGAGALFGFNADCANFGTAGQVGGIAAIVASLLDGEGEAELAAEREAPVEASTPTGQRGSPMDVPRGTNGPANINGISYGGHALDEMQSEGFTPSVVEDTIAHGEKSVGASGRVAYYSPGNNITVITENGRVVTVTSGSVNVR